MSEPQPPPLSRVVVTLPTVTPRMRIALRELLAVAASLAWGPAIMFHACLFIAGFAMLSTSSANDLTGLLARLKSHPATPTLFYWLGIEGDIRNADDIMAIFRSILGRVVFATYLLSLLGRAILPERFHPGLWFKAGFLTLLSVAEAAFFVYAVRFIKLGEGTSYGEMVGVCIALCVFCWASTMAAFVTADVLLAWCVRRLNGEPAALPAAAQPAA